MSGILTESISETETDIGSDLGWRTTLFNCECHSFDEVERQLQKAVRCTLSEARRFSWEVHATGSAVVYSGTKERCEAASAILEHIGLRTSVSPS